MAKASTPTRHIDVTDSRNIEPVYKLRGRAWGYVFGRSLREFGRDGCLDLAAGLTYRTIFAIFPALLAIVSILGLVGQGRATTDFLVDAIATHGSQSIANVLENPIDQLASGSGAGLAFAIGVAGAAWTSSNYVVSFSKALNRIFDVREGRSTLALRSTMYLLTLALLIAAVVVISILIFSGSVMRAVGDVVGLGDEVITLWSWAKWPVLVVVVVLMVASLYYFTPNVRRDRFPWLSVGALVALIVLALATSAFGFYLTNFANYNKTYGSIGGVIAMLLWIWIANSVLLLGAEIDSEIERAKQLQSGIAAERTLQLPPRAEGKSDKAASKLEKDVYAGRELRAQANPITAEEIPHRNPWRPLLWVAGGIGAIWRVKTLVRRREDELAAAAEDLPDDA